MSLPTVEHIIDLIDQLPSAERLALEERLAERTEAQWREEASQAREQARDRGVDQAAIDCAVAAHRYET